MCCTALEIAGNHVYHASVGVPSPRVTVDDGISQIFPSLPGNATTTVELVMFTSAYEAPTSSLVIWDEATPTAIQEELTLRYGVSYVLFIRGFHVGETNDTIASKEAIHVQS